MMSSAAMVLYFQAFVMAASFTWSLADGDGFTTQT